MHKMKPGLILSLMMLLTGCIAVSIHPLYTEKDVQFNPDLLGTWKGANDKGQLIFKKTENNGYDMTFIEQEDSARFEVYLVQLDRKWFLDIYPEGSGKICDLHLAVHHFARIWIEKDTMKLAILSYEWLKDSFEKKEIKLNHEIDNGYVVLTASTPDLQKFIKKYADNPEVFPDPLTFIKSN